jgi:branched-chain amino acid transport system ATP-binding protein
MAERAVDVQELDAGYSQRPVVSDVTMQVNKGEIVALIGPNGAGKSTILKVLCGLLRPLRGSVRVFGEDVARTTPDRLVERGIAYVPQGGRVFGSLTVRENLLVATRGPLRGATTEAQLKETYQLFSQLEARATVRAGLLSAGERQMLALARGFICGRRLLLVDEPTGGLAPTLAADVLATLRRMQHAGARTLVIVEQNTGYALSVADRVYGLKLGRSWIDGVLPATLSREKLRDLFF